MPCHVTGITCVSLSNQLKWMGLSTVTAYRYGITLVGFTTVCLLAWASNGPATIFVHQLTPAAVEQERLILLELYNLTGGSRWKIKAGWDAHAHCQWQGVVCCMPCEIGSATLSYSLPDPVSGRQLAQPCRTEGAVTALLLGGFGLQGNLSPGIVALQSLEVLRLDGNPGLQGSLPLELLHRPYLREVDVRGTGMSYRSSSGSSSSSGSGMAVSAAPVATQGQAMTMSDLPPCTLPEGFSSSNEYMLHSGPQLDVRIPWPGGILACSSFLHREGAQQANASSVPSRNNSSSGSAVAATEADAVESASAGDLGTPAGGTSVWMTEARGHSSGTARTSLVPTSPPSPIGTMTTLLLSSPSYWEYGLCVCLRVLGGGAVVTVAEATSEAMMALGAAGASYLLNDDASTRRQPSAPAAGTTISPPWPAANNSRGFMVPLGVVLGVVIPVSVGAIIAWVLLLILLCGSSTSRVVASNGSSGSTGSKTRIWFRLRLPLLWPGAVLSPEPATVPRIDAASGPSIAGACNVASSSGRVTPSCPSPDATAAAAVAAAASRASMREESLHGRISATKRAKPPGSYPALFGDCVTLVATDVEGSTELWEWQPDAMNHALALHDRLARLSISMCCGYEITTEGDAFLVAFHDPVDAVRWALLLQSALLKLDWPPLLLEHPLCRPRPLVPVAAAAPTGGTGGATSSAPLLVLFKGLSVRMGIATGVPSSVREHPITQRMQYTGAVLRLATGIAELGSGGQVLVEPMTFKGIHNKIEELDVMESEVQELAEKANSRTRPLSCTNEVITEDDPLGQWTDSSRHLPQGANTTTTDNSYYQSSRARPSLSRHASLNSRQQMPFRSLSRMSFGQTTPVHDNASRQAIRRGSWMRGVPAQPAPPLTPLPPRGVQQHQNAPLGSSLPAALAHPSRTHTTMVQLGQSPQLHYSSQLYAAGCMPTRSHHASRLHGPAGAGPILTDGGGGGGGGGYCPSASNCGSSMFLTSYGSPANGIFTGTYLQPGGGGLSPLAVLSSARGSNDWLAVHQALLGYASNNGPPTVLQSLYGSNTSRQSKPLTPFDLAALLGSRASVESSSAAGPAHPVASNISAWPSTIAAGVPGVLPTLPRTNLQGLFLRTLTAGIGSESITATTHSTSDKRTNALNLPADVAHEQHFGRNNIAITIPTAVLTTTASSDTNRVADPTLNGMSPTGEAVQPAGGPAPAVAPSPPPPLSMSLASSKPAMTPIPGPRSPGGCSSASETAALVGRLPLGTIMSSTTSSDQMMDLAAVTLQGGLFAGGFSNAVGSAANADGYYHRLGADLLSSRHRTDSSNGVPYFQGSSGGTGSYALLGRTGRQTAGAPPAVKNPGPIAEATEEEPTQIQPLVYGSAGTTLTTCSSSGGARVRPGAVPVPAAGGRRRKYLSPEDLPLATGQCSGDSGGAVATIAPTGTTCATVGDDEDETLLHLLMSTTGSSGQGQRLGSAQGITTNSAVQQSSPLSRTSPLQAGPPAPRVPPSSSSSSRRTMAPLSAGRSLPEMGAPSSAGLGALTGALLAASLGQPHSSGQSSPAALGLLTGAIARSADAQLPEAAVIHMQGGYQRRDEGAADRVKLVYVTDESDTPHGYTRGAGVGSESFSFVPVTRGLSAEVDRYVLDFGLGAGRAGRDGGYPALPYDTSPPRIATPTQLFAPQPVMAPYRGVRRSTSFNLRPKPVFPSASPTGHGGAHPLASGACDGGGGSPLSRAAGGPFTLVDRTATQQDAGPQNREPLGDDFAMPSSLPWLAPSRSGTTEPMYDNGRRCVGEWRRPVNFASEPQTAAPPAAPMLNTGATSAWFVGSGGGGGVGVEPNLTTGAGSMTPGRELLWRETGGVRATTLAQAHAHGAMHPYPHHHQHYHHQPQNHHGHHLPGGTMTTHGFVHRLASSTTASVSNSPLVAPSATNTYCAEYSAGANGGGSEGEYRPAVGSESEAQSATVRWGCAGVGSGAAAAINSSSIQDPMPDSAGLAPTPQPPPSHASPRSSGQGGICVIGPARWSSELGSVAGRHMSLRNANGASVSRGHESLTLALPTGPGATNSGAGGGGGGGSSLTGRLSVTQLAGHLMLGSIKGRGSYVISENGSAVIERGLQSGVADEAVSPPSPTPPAAAAAATSKNSAAFLMPLSATAVASQQQPLPFGGFASAAGGGSGGIEPLASTSSGPGRMALPRPSRTTTQTGHGSSAGGVSGPGPWRSAYSNLSAADLDAVAGCTAPALGRARGGPGGTLWPHASYAASDVGGTVGRGSRTSLPVLWQDPSAGCAASVPLAGVALLPQRRTSGEGMLLMLRSAMALEFSGSCANMTAKEARDLANEAVIEKAEETADSCGEQAGGQPESPTVGRSYVKSRTEEGMAYKTGKAGSAPTPVAPSQCDVDQDSGTSVRIHAAVDQNRGRRLSYMRPIHNAVAVDGRTGSGLAVMRRMRLLGDHGSSSVSDRALLFPKRVLSASSGAMPGIHAKSEGDEPPSRDENADILIMTETTAVAAPPALPSAGVSLSFGVGLASAERRSQGLLRSALGAPMSTAATTGLTAAPGSAEEVSPSALSFKMLGDKTRKMRSLAKLQNASMFPRKGKSTLPLSQSATAVAAQAPWLPSPPPHPSGSLSMPSSGGQVPVATATQPPQPPHHGRSEEAVRSHGASSHALIVIDMGVHRLQLPALGPAYGDVYDGVQVIQLLPAHLKHRAAYQPPLKSQAQLAPGFLDAPGAAKALLPCPPSQPPSFPRLSLMFIQPAGYSTVANTNLEVAERSGAVFCAAVREVLQMYGAYECQEYECTFMVACSSPRVAAEAGLALQEWLLQADWPTDLFELSSGRLALGPDGRPMLRGFRAKVGIFTGVPLSVVPHATTGRADYFGAMVNRAARLMAGAKAGQVLMDKVAGLEVMREWRQVAADAATASGASAPTHMDVWQLSSIGDNLSIRMSPSARVSSAPGSTALLAAAASLSPQPVGEAGPSGMQAAPTPQPQAQAPPRPAPQPPWWSEEEAKPSSEDTVPAAALLSFAAGVLPLPPSAADCGDFLPVPPVEVPQYVTTAIPRASPAPTVDAERIAVADGAIANLNINPIALCKRDNSAQQPAMPAVALSFSPLIAASIATSAASGSVPLASRTEPGPGAVPLYPSPPLPSSSGIAAAAVAAPVATTPAAGSGGGITYEHYLAALGAGGLASTVRAVVVPSTVQLVDLGTYKFKGLLEGQAVLSVQLKSAWGLAATATAATTATATAAGNGGGGGGERGGESPGDQARGAGGGEAAGGGRLEPCGLGKKAALLTSGKGLLEEVLVALPMPLPLSGGALVAT